MSVERLGNRLFREEEGKPEPMFGNNIRDAWRVLRFKGEGASSQEHEPIDRTSKSEPLFGNNIRDALKDRGII